MKGHQSQYEVGILSYGRSVLICKGFGKFGAVILILSRHVRNFEVLHQWTRPLEATRYEWVRDATPLRAWEGTRQLTPLFTAPIKVNPPQAAVATWRPAWCFGSGNLEISSGDYHWALGLLQMCAKFLTWPKAVHYNFLRLSEHFSQKLYWRQLKMGLYLCYYFLRFNNCYSNK